MRMSPLPLNWLPSRRLSPGSACRVVSSRYVVPNEPAERIRVRRERDRELRQEPLETEPLGRELHRARLVCPVEGFARGIAPRRVGLVRVRRCAEHLLVPLVVRLEVVARYGPRLVLVVDERARVLAEDDIRVDERAAAEPARDDPADAAKRPDVPDPV